MAATVQISESNGAGEVVTDDVDNINLGSTDAKELVASSYPITAGANSYEKWIRIKVSDISTSEYIYNFKVWLTSADPYGDDDMYCSCTTVSYASIYPYAAPVSTESSYATVNMTTHFVSEPSLSNLGFNNSTTATMGDGQYSDYAVFQLRVDAGSTAGDTGTFNFKYTEVA